MKYYQLRRPIYGTYDFEGFEDYDELYDLITSGTSKSKFVKRRIGEKIV